MTEKSFKLDIVSPEGSVCSVDAVRMTVPTSSGEITVLPDHAPLFTRLTEGEIIVSDGSEDTYVGITGGFLEIAGNAATVLADFAVRSDAVVTAQAELAKRKAEEAMRQNKDRVNFSLVENELRKAIVSLKVSGRVKKQNKGATS